VSLKVDILRPENLIKEGLGHFRRTSSSAPSALFARLTALYPKRADGWNNRGFVLMKVGEMRWAMDCFEKAVDLDPGYVVALVNLKRAESSWPRCPGRRRPRTCRSRWRGRRGRTRRGELYKRGKYAEALARFDDILRVNPTDEEALNNRGMALMGLGRHAEAVECFDEALELDPEYALARDNRLRCLRLVALGP